MNVLYVVVLDWKTGDVVTETASLHSVSRRTEGGELTTYSYSLPSS